MRPAPAGGERFPTWIFINSWLLSSQGYRGLGGYKGDCLFVVYYIGHKTLHQDDTISASEVGSLQAQRRLSSLQLFLSCCSDGGALSNMTRFLCFHMFQQHKAMKTGKWRAGTFSGRRSSGSCWMWLGGCTIPTDLHR